MDNSQTASLKDSLHYLLEISQNLNLVKENKLSEQDFFNFIKRRSKEWGYISDPKFIVKLLDTVFPKPDDKKLTEFLSWEKNDGLYCIQARFNDGKEMTIYKQEADFQYHMFKLKLQNEYNLPHDILQELDDIVIDLNNEAVDNSNID